jgi:arylformamidase
MIDGEIQFLSYFLDDATPGYGGLAGFKSRSVKSMLCGDASNSQWWELSNHIGTHIDAPFHFSMEGRKIDEFPASFWKFEHPFLVDRPSELNELIGPESWAEQIPQECDLLLLRTGFEKRRDREEYWSSNPGLLPELGRWLRAHRGQLRAIGFDMISLTSYQNRPVGRESHKAFLGTGEPGHPILIIEDMKLGELSGSPNWAIVSPLRVRGADGAPVTVIAGI